MKRVDDKVIIEEGINKAAKQSDPFLGRIPEIPYGEYQQASFKGKKGKIINHLMETGMPLSKEFPGLIEDLKDFERLLYATNKLYRDHVFHTLRVWGLGLYLYNNGLREFIKEEKRPHFQFTWYLASTYHDVGYPISSLKKISKDFNHYFDYLGINELVNFEKIINPVLSDTSLNDELMKLFPGESEEINRSVLQQSHGLAGARLLLFRLNQRFSSWSEEAYPALKAIGKHDGTKSISFSNEPFSALLVICDELQEWGRPYISPLLGEKYVTTDHIELEMRSDGSTPCVKALIDYSGSQKDLQEILGWKAEIAKKDREDNLKRLSGIKVDVEMIYS